MSSAKFGIPGLCILGLILVFSAGFHFGGASAKQKALEVDNARLSKAFEQGQATGTVRDVVVTQYVDRDRVIYKTGATITKEVPVYVSAQADAACAVPRGFVRLHDAAAASVLPGPAGAADAAGSGIALSAVTAVVVDNYTTCNAVRNQLMSLQKWVRDTQNTINAKPGSATSE